MQEWIHAGSVEEIRNNAPKLLSGGIAVFVHEGEFYAVDNRCPHMGFPLHLGSVCDGILTCHWHHARFDVQSGGTLDPWADDALVHDVRVEQGELYVSSRPRQARSHQQHLVRLREGLEQNISLIIAKSVVALMQAGVPESEIAKVGVEFGTRERSNGWGPGLTILTAMVNVLPKLSSYSKVLALVQGLVHVAQDCAGRPARHTLQALPSPSFSLERLTDWYRQCAEVRDAQGAERVVLAAVEQGHETNPISEMMLAAATDHFYLDGGHTFDFHNKALEMLEHTGQGARKNVLTALTPLMANPTRSEELQNWRAPVDLVKPVQQAIQVMEADAKDAPQEGTAAFEATAFVDQVLSDLPLDTVALVTKAFRQGVPSDRLAQLVALAAAERIARFHVQNDFGDWIAVLHTFTNAHAVHMRLRANPDSLARRGVYHAAMRIYLDRFLNIPSAKRPVGRAASNTEGSHNASQLLNLLDQRQQVDSAAQWVADYLAAGGDTDELWEVLGEALLREDAEFHSFQMYEAASREYDLWAQEPGDFAKRAKETLLFAVTRYLAAHAPTARELPNVVRIAWRLHRGEKLFEEEDATSTSDEQVTEATQ